MLEADFSAREILVDIVKKMHGIDNISVNDTTNTLSTRIIFGKNKSPQNQFNYRDLGEVSNEDYIVDGFDEYTINIINRYFLDMNFHLANHIIEMNW